MRDASERKVFLKQIRPMHTASAEPLASMTTRHVKKADLQGIARETHELLARKPQRGEAVNIRWGAQALTKGNKKATTIMKMFPELFVESVVDGTLLFWHIRLRLPRGPSGQQAKRFPMILEWLLLRRLQMRRRITRSVVRANPGREF